MNTTTAPSDSEGHDLPGDVSALVRLVDGVPPPDTAKPGEPDSPRRTRTSQPRQPVLFSFDGLPLRTVKVKGEPWFVAKDACAALGLDNASLALNGRADRKWQDGLGVCRAFQHFRERGGLRTMGQPS